MSKSSNVCGVGISDWLGIGADVDTNTKSKTVIEEGLPLFLAALGVRWEILLVQPSFSCSSSAQLLEPSAADPKCLTLVLYHLPCMHPDI